MKFIQLTESIRASVIIQGTMGFCSSWNDEPYDTNQVRNAIQVIETALEEGINIFDHADIYAMGKSEQIFAEAVKQMDVTRDSYYLQSKCGIRFPGQHDASIPGRYDFSYSHIINSVEGSLTRLGTDYLDILLLHRPDFLMEGEEVAKAFSELHSAGKVRNFGISNHTPMQIEYLASYVEQPLICNQVRYNLLDPDLLEGELTGSPLPVTPIGASGLIPYTRLKGITLQAYSPLAKGQIFGKNLSGKNQAYKDKAARCGSFVSELANDLEVLPETIAIAWILRHPSRIMPVIGTTKPERIRSAALATAVDLSREQWYSLLQASRGMGVP